MTPCYSLIQFGTQLCGPGRIQGTNTSFGYYKSVGAVWKKVWKNLLCKPWARNAEQTSFPLLVAYGGCVFSISSGDAELSSEPYVGTDYTTIRRRNPEAFYLLGHGGWTFGARYSLLSLFLFLLPDQRLYVVKSVCVCVRVCVYIYIYIYIYIYNIWLRMTVYMNYRFYQIILRVAHFYTNREQCEVLTGYLSMGCRRGGEWANMWHWTEHFTVLFSNRK